MTTMASSMCGPQEYIAFITSLPNAQTCGEGINVSFQGPGAVALTSDEGRQKFAGVCTQDCAGRIAEWLRITCNDPLQSLDIGLWCYETDGQVGDYCRYATGDVFNVTFLENLDVCMAATPQVPCAPGCADALNALTIQIGCCYQNLYNNSEYISGLLSRNFITQDQYDGLLDLGNNNDNPWIGCEIQAPMSCEANPGTGVTAPPTTMELTTAGELGLKTKTMFVLIVSLFLTLIMYKQ